MTMLHDLLRAAVAAKASDVHVHANAAPLFRINTVVGPSQFPVMSAESVTALLREMMPEPSRWAAFEQNRDSDFSYAAAGVGRFRVNAHFQRGGIAISLRVIGEKVRRLEELFLPDVVAKLTTLPRGLVLVTGPTGSGKSTTLAGMIDTINRRDAGHILTLEDPIEFEFASVRSAIEQREVGRDVASFENGLRHALRQDPDVIYVGEMRDLETTRAALTAAETGHLVFSTLHTAGAAQTVERIIDIYPADQQTQVRTMLAGTLQAVVSQTLIPRIDQPGMIAAVEILLCNSAVRTCIRENRVFEIANVISTSRAVGMQSLDDSIRQLYTNGYISRADALGHANQPEKLDRALAA